MDVQGARHRQLPPDSNDLTTSELVDSLRLLPKLRELHLQAPLRSNPDPQPLLQADFRAPSIPSLSLDGLILMHHNIVSVVTRHFRETDGGSTATILRATSKETLRELVLYDVGAVPTVVRWLSQPGLKLDSPRPRLLFPRSNRCA